MEHRTKWWRGTSLTRRPSPSTFVDHMQERWLGPKIFTGRWFRYGVLNAHNRFMIE